MMLRIMYHSALERFVRNMSAYTPMAWRRPDSRLVTVEVERSLFIPTARRKMRSISSFAPRMARPAGAPQGMLVLALGSFGVGVIGVRVLVFGVMSFVVMVVGPFGSRSTTSAGGGVGGFEGEDDMAGLGCSDGTAVGGVVGGLVSIATCGSRVG